MSCAACEQAQAGDRYYYPLRVGTGNVEVRGCRDHVSELVRAYRLAPLVTPSTGPLPAGQSGTIGFAITECWLFVSVGPDGEEGLIAGQAFGGPMMPFVACDQRRLELLLVAAEDIAATTGMLYRVKHMVFHQ